VLERWPEGDRPGPRWRTAGQLSAQAPGTGVFADSPPPRTARACALAAGRAGWRRPLARPGPVPALPGVPGTSRGPLGRRPGGVPRRSRTGHAPGRCRYAALPARRRPGSSAATCVPSPAGTPPGR
jgi:hypothetical protein